MNTIYFAVIERMLLVVECCYNYVHLSLNAVICESLTKLDIKVSVWCIVTLRDKTKMLIGVVYRSPSSNSESNAKLITTISNIEDYYDCADLLLMGDFNTPNVDWKDFTCSDSRSSFAHNFINATLDSYLTQHIYKPTQHVFLDKNPLFLI